MSGSLPYRKALIIGATSGIGAALAEKFISAGTHVIAVGRREPHLNTFTRTHGPKLSSSYTLDISDLSSLPTFASTVTREHPDLDLVFLNSGMQRGFNFAKPETVDLDLVAAELNTNYTAHVALSMTLLPHLLARAAQGSPTMLGFTTSGLAMTPLMRCPNYSASKAALHAWILCLREQVRGLPSGLKVVELLPPAVQTELHDERHQPDLKDGRSMGMPLGEFTEGAWEGLVKGWEQIPVGFAGVPFKEGGFEVARQVAFRGMNGLGK